MLCSTICRLIVMIKYLWLVRVAVKVEIFMMPSTISRADRPCVSLLIQRYQFHLSYKIWKLDDKFPLRPSNHPPIKSTERAALVVAFSITACGGRVFAGYDWTFAGLISNANLQYLWSMGFFGCVYGNYLICFSIKSVPFAVIAKRYTDCHILI